MAASLDERMKLKAIEARTFELIQQHRYDDAKQLLSGGTVRIDRLDTDGMTLLATACFRGADDLVELLLALGSDANARCGSNGYTCLMFAALSGNPLICRRLLDAGARSDIVSCINKTAAEIAAFVGRHECVSVINSYISLRDVEKIVHPNGAKSARQYPETMIAFIHRLTRSNEIHPVRLALNMVGEPTLMRHRKTIENTVDTLFERQMRCREPNEVMAMKLWLILFTLRELMKFIDGRLQAAVLPAKEDDAPVMAKAIHAFAKNLLQASPDDVVRPKEERFLRAAILAFPYKQSLVYQAMARNLSKVEVGQAPSAYLIACQQLFGIRFVQTVSFCLACGMPSASKRCKACKQHYCSAVCQKLDWFVHKNVCQHLAETEHDENEMPTVNDEEADNDRPSNDQSVPSAD